MAPSLPAAAPAEASQRDLDKDAKIKELREKLTGEAGDKAGQQLVQGGELQTASELTGDAFLHRWLRARGWDIERAYNAIVRHAEWRVTMMPNGKVDEASIANELACEKVYIHGHDRKGRPLMIIQVKKHNGWTRNLEELERLCCYILDECVGRVQVSEVNPRGQCCALLDLTDMGALSMDIQAIKTLFALLGEHYVERLGAMYFYNPPYIFWGAWNTLSPLLPEPTRNKIKVIDPSQNSELLELVDPDILPKEYGGNAPLGAPLGKA